MKRRSAIGSPASSGSPGSTRPSTPLREEEPGGWCRGGKGGMGTVGGDEVARWDGGGGGGKEERIWVSVRLRPLNAKEGERNDASDWECINDTTIIFKNSVADRAMFPTAYSFDRVFDCESTSRQVYEEGAKEVALSVVSGINSSIFAYGQTSSGKTYTMTGITEYSVADIYDYIQKHKEREFVVKFSAMEIYNEAVRDLLSADSSPLRLLDDPERGTIVEKLTEETLRDESHLKELLAVCEAQRQIGETSLNEMSSRSHQILRLTIESSAREYLGRASSTTLAATVNFVDLAGSERASQALTAGTRLKEGCHINRSLLTLGTVIRKLSKGRNGHVPYRDSKLTRILQSALGGNARTAIICTMSPARSHIEQSRNTLLFATCAKEVATSAQVNVVMSEKALVKHLQRELARLESQLRYPGTDTSTEHSEVLLKEKDAQIKKMEKDIMELQQQRDLAQSRLEELLRVVGDDRASGQWEECSQSSVSHTRNLSEDGYSISETSDISSPKHSICSPMSSGLALDQRLESAQAGSEDSDHCKEVRCIEINELSTSRSDEFNLLLNEEIDSLLPLTDADKLVDPIPQPTGEMPFTPAVDQQLESVIKTVDNFVRAYPDGSSSQSLFRDISGSRVLVLTRSRSCRASLMTIADSSWFEDAEMSNKTPPNSFLKKFPGRPEGILRNPSSSTSSAENVELLVEGSQASEGLSSNDAVGTASQSSEQLSSGDVVITQETKTTSKKLSPDDAVRVRSQDIKTTSQSSEQLSTDDLSITQEIKTIAEKLSPDDAVNAQNIEATLEEDVSSSDLVSDLKEMDQLQYQKQFTSNQKMQQTASEDSGVQKIVKDVCQDPMSNALESPSQWPLEFEKKQKEIIELWHECNVSLIHRTYFFVLFKGDPADSIYVEVEHRRLSFLKRTFTYGDLSMTATLESSNVSPASSLRNLRRERDMLYRQMLRKLSAEERVSLYTKWGIDLNSKQRKLQLAQCLWTKTDMEHVSESASLVAKLIGLLEPGQALKEMFGLTFSLQQTHRRSYSWIQGKSSFRAIAPY